MYATLVLALALAGEGPAAPAGTNAAGIPVYIGTYTGKDSQGIYRTVLDLDSGTLSAPELVAETVSPSFLAIHPNRRFLYAVNEIGQFEGKPAGSVSAFAIDPVSGKLTLLNRKTSGGGAPCHLVVDRTGRAVLLANYGGGSVESLPIGSDGSLGEPASFVQHRGKSVDPARQEGPHAHSINLDAGNRFAAAADLGLDKVFVYPFDPASAALKEGEATSASLAPGSGPRHFAFHPDGTHAYVINEMALTVTGFAYDPAKGTLKEFQTISTLPEGTTDRTGFSTAEVQVHPSGRFLYGSNRGHNTLAIFGIEPGTGKLAVVGHQATGGKTPRNFGIEPGGKYLLAANQDSGSVVVFRVDPQTGKLEATGSQIRVGSPVCVKFVPRGE